MIVHDMEQGTDEWFAVRRGLPTSSQFATIMANGRGGAPSKTRQTYMYKLAGELLTGDPMDNFTNHHMERGHEMEPDARRYYEFMEDVQVEQIGFITNFGAGCSPDGHVGKDGMTEIKTKLPHLLLPILEADKFPEEHKAQCQGQLWVAEREWVDMICYWPKMPTLIKRAYRDEPYIKTISEAVAQFNDELNELVEKYQPEQRIAA